MFYKQRCSRDQFTILRILMVLLIPVNAKVVELWGLECGGTFIIQTSSLKIGCLVHKMGFVATEVAGTVI